MRALTCLLVVLALAGAICAQVVGPLPRLPNVFSDHMVLQRDKPLPVWGWADPGEVVTVSFAGRSYRATADAAGAWRVTMKPCKAGGPHELKVAVPAHTIVRTDILVGEVWVCSGQSNMEMSVGGALNGQAEIAAATDAQIRLFTVARKIADTPQEDVLGKWAVCSPKTVGGFSAAAYFFARELRRNLGVPVGLIQSCWSGTPAESWTSPAMLKSNPALAPTLARRFTDKDAFAAADARFKTFYAQWEQAHYVVDTGNAGVTLGWAKADFDDSAWRPMRAPVSWERNEPAFYMNGVLWHRRAVEIPAAWAGHALTLKLGKIGDVDTTYVNGVQIGTTGADDLKANAVPRVYTIPAAQVKAGRISIAVRVFNRWGEGGFIGPADQFSLAPERLGEIAAAPAPEVVPLSLAGEWKYSIERQVDDPAGPHGPIPPDSSWSPGKLFDGMIAPLIPYGIRGALWYQGESNGGYGYQYRTLFPAMIQSWRTAWGQGDFPFLYVQLANWLHRQDVPGDCCWAELREAQLLTLKLRNTGMAVAIDIGDGNDIHPKNKQEVGRRLALNALATVYGRKIVYSGPLYTRMRVKGETIVLAFDHANGGLTARDGKPLTAFQIAGADRKFVWAEAKIEGNTVVVRSPAVPRPAAVRYGWHYNPDCTLTNAAGLPASPFRTDDWPGVTMGVE
jgi:sialate O-acetylesterase